MALAEYLATTAVDPDRLTSLLLDPEGTLRSAGFAADALAGPEDPEEPEKPHPDTLFVVSLNS